MADGDQVRGGSVFGTVVRVLVIWLVLTALLTLTGAMGSVEFTIATVVAVVSGVLWGRLSRR